MNLESKFKRGQSLVFVCFYQKRPTVTVQFRVGTLLETVDLSSDFGLLDFDISNYNSPINFLKYNICNFYNGLTICGLKTTLTIFTRFFLKKNKPFE